MIQTNGNSAAATIEDVSGVNSFGNSGKDIPTL